MKLTGDATGAHPPAGGPGRSSQGERTMLTDFSQNLERLEKALGEQYRQSGFILGTPGTSLACKVDPFYYLAIEPGFIKHLSRWAGMFPESARETLVKTGNLLTDPSRSVFVVPLAVFEEGSSEVVRVGASFVPAAFIDQAVTRHGGADAPLPVSRLRILEADRARAEPFFIGKTPLHNLAFGNPTQR